MFRDQHLEHRRRLRRSPSRFFVFRWLARAVACCVALLGEANAINITVGHVTRRAVFQRLVAFFRHSTIPATHAPINADEIEGEVAAAF